MQTLGSSKEEAIERFESTVSKDLSDRLEADVRVKFFTGGEAKTSEVIVPEFQSARSLESLISKETLESALFDKVKEDPSILRIGDSRGYFYSDILRSRCPITSQPDWGTIYIKLEGNQGFDSLSLLQYLVSLRTENHFHEEIVECVYSRLWKLYKPENLTVTALYTRRGGIDICPTRSSDSSSLPLALIDHRVLVLKEYRS